MTKIENTNKAIVGFKERSQNQAKYIGEVKKLSLLSQAVNCSLYSCKYCSFGEEFETASESLRKVNSYVGGVLGHLGLTPPTSVEVFNFYKDSTLEDSEYFSKIATLALYTCDDCQLIDVNDEVFEIVDSLCIKIESLSRKLKECVIRNQ